MQNLFSYIFSNNFFNHEHNKGKNSLANNPQEKNLNKSVHQTDPEKERQQLVDLFIN